jgi:hypothetical protein
MGLLVLESPLQQMLWLSCHIIDSNRLSRHLPTGRVSPGRSPKGSYHALECLEMEHGIRESVALHQ